VLLVEDDEAVRSLAHEVLAGSGYRVLVASRGSEALTIGELHGGPIHLLVTDVLMPGIDGRQLAERLLASRPGTKVLYISGYTDEVVPGHGISEAAVNFLHKPLLAADLTQKVREVLDSTG
jgi:CheY-like chemotaxis protein